MIHPDILDFGLTQISNSANWNGGVMKQVICVGTPANLTEATTLYPTGKRVSSEISMAGGDFTLQNKSGGGREVVVAAKVGTVAATITGTKDLKHAMYDGSRLLIVAEETTDRDLSVVGDTITIPTWKASLREE